MGPPPFFSRRRPRRSDYVGIVAVFALIYVLAVVEHPPGNLATWIVSALLIGAGMTAVLLIHKSRIDEYERQHRS